MKRSALSVVISFALSAGSLFAETTYPSWESNGSGNRPYIFTQQHNVENRPDAEGRVQLIRLGYPLKVQLPGNPALWTFQPEASKNVEYRGRTMVYSPDRIAGTESILVFDLVLAPDALPGSEGHFTFTTDELPPSLDNVIPEGVYVVRFSVIDPS